MHALNPAWEALKRDFDTACVQAAASARAQVSAELNQAFRRLRQYGREDEWFSAVIDAAAVFAPSVAVFSLSGDALQLRGQQGLNVPAELRFQANDAAAFRSVIASRDPVIALRSPGEVTAALAFEESGAPTRAHLFPIANGSRVVAVLFASGDSARLDANGLELMAGLAGAVLERQSNTALHAQIAPAVLPEENAAGKSALWKNGHRNATLPAWSQLDEKQRALHIRAQRFSRVVVAELQLARPEACRAGRESGNLYTLLKTEIDKARASYRRQFMTIPSMVDYLHLELIGAAAEGDEAKLGDEYPGHLV